MEFGEGLKKIFLAGVGAVATTAETTKDIVDKLVEKGELTVEQGKVFNEELKNNAKKKMQERANVKSAKNFESAYSSVESMSEEELEKLKAHIEEVADAKAEDAEEDEDIEEGIFDDEQETEE